MSPIVRPLALAVALVVASGASMPAAAVREDLGYLLSALSTPHGHRLSQAVSNELVIRDLALVATVRLTERRHPRGGYVLELDAGTDAPLLSLIYRPERLDRDAHARAFVDAVLVRLRDAGLLRRVP